MSDKWKLINLYTNDFNRTPYNVNQKMALLVIEWLKELSFKVQRKLWKQIVTKMGFSFTNIDGKMPSKSFQSAIKNWFRLLMVFLTFSIANCEREFNKTESEHEKTDCTAFLIGKIISFFYSNVIVILEKRKYSKKCFNYFSKHINK